MINNILRMENITKIYSNGFVANKNIHFSVNEGEIHALMGENGAGKSTLMKVLFGIEKPQEGKIYFQDNEVHFSSPEEAMRCGICMVHQHFMLIPSLSVAENMVLGIEPVKHGLLNINEAIEMTQKIAKKYRFDVNPKEKIKNLTLGQKQKVEILKALLRGAKVLILDEPTAVLTPQETQELFSELEFLKNQGTTIIFISHKLKEIKQVADRITVLRNGKFEASAQVDAVTEKEISRLMVGRDVVLKIDKTKQKTGKVCLQVKDVNYKNMFNKKKLTNINFEVCEGEIVGIAGVEGNGQNLLVDLITRAKKANTGKILINGNTTDGVSIKQIREMGMAHIPEDRISYGVASSMSIEENLISNQFYHKTYNKFCLLDNHVIKDNAKRLINKYQVKCNSSTQHVKDLSGGNIQKVVVARELSLNPKFLVANQPTRGIDVGSAEFIYKQLVLLRDSGTGILLISADLSEVMELSDRLLIMCDGAIVAEFTNLSKVSENVIGEYMLGLKRDDGKQKEVMRA